MRLVLRLKQSQIFDLVQKLPELTKQHVLWPLFALKFQYNMRTFSSEECAVRFEEQAYVLAHFLQTQNACESELVKI